MNKTLSYDSKKSSIAFLLLVMMLIPLIIPLFQVSADPVDNIVDINIEKVWVGGSPVPIEVNLYADDVFQELITITEDDNWIKTVKVPIYNDLDEEIVYSIEEMDVDGFDSEITGSVQTGFVITNTEIIIREEEKTSITVNKEWVGTKLNEVEVNLLADNTLIDSIILNEDNDWEHTFNDLYVYYVDADDNLIRYNYSIEEKETPGYETSITNVGNNYTIVNTEKAEELPAEPETFDINIEKVWIGEPLENIAVKLYVNEIMEGVFEMSEQTGWKLTIDNLDIYDENGEEIKYAIEEYPVDGYTSEITGSVEKGFVITNTEDPKPLEPISVRVDKIWIGGELPQAIISLVADGREIVDTIVLNNSNNWTHTFTNLPAEKNDVKINYSITEHENEGYEIEITGNAQKGFVVKNTKKSIEEPVNPELTTVNVKKIWKDGKEKEATVALTANNDVVNVAVLNENSNWSYTFYNLPKHDKFNNEIKYSILEFGQENYETKITGNAESGFVVTNTKTNENVKDNKPSKPRLPVIPPTSNRTIDVDVKQVWVGEEKVSSKVYLLANGREIENITLTSANKWKHTFKNLPASKNGKSIEYTIESASIDGYEIEITGNVRTGFAMVSTQLEEEVTLGEIKTQDLIVKKVWVGQPGEKATVILYADDVEVDRVILSPDNKWEHTFKDLPEAISADAIDTILYTVEAIPMESYETEVNYLFDTSVNDGDLLGFTVTSYKIGEDNSSSEFVNVHVRKTWVGKMLSNATVHLLANREIVDTIVLNENNNWEYTFRTLNRKDENGKAIQYSVEEEMVKGYHTKIVKVEENAYVIINEEIDGSSGITGDRDGIIKDVRTYDGGVISIIVISILSIIAFIGITYKKKQL